MPRIDFSQAMRVLLAEKRKVLANHCTLAELEAYREGTLPADRQESVVDHLSACEDCTILLLYAMPEADDAAATTERVAREIEESWERLRPRLDGRAPEGRTLAAVLAYRRPSFEETLPLALEISRALASLHSAGRIHPDLRAENVLVTDAGEARLLERGPAPTPETFEIGYGGAAEQAVSDLYRSLSPEQVGGEVPDQRSNLFSLGVLLYELLTGVSPFRAHTPLETASRIVSLDPAPASEINPAVPLEVSALIGGLLAKEAEDRPADATVVVQELRSVLGRHQPGGSAPRTQALNLEEEIELQYDEVAALVHEQTDEGQPREEEIERAYTRLRELQAAEAQEFRSRFEASLAMPIGSGQQLLERLRSLRKELEDLASADPASRKADNP